MGTIERMDLYFQHGSVERFHFYCFYFAQILSCGVYLNTVFIPGQTVLLSCDASEVIVRNNCCLQCRLTAGDSSFEHLKYNL